MKYSLIDTHCDTASEALDKNAGFFGNTLHIDLAKMKDIEYTQFFAAYIAPEYKDTAMKRVLEIIRKVKSETAKNNKISLCKSYDDYLKNKGKIKAFLSLEGGEAITDKKALLTLYKEGIRMAALTWNYSNHLAAGVLEADENKGLTPFGREIVTEMNRLGILIDVSHLNDKSFWDIISLSKIPVVASHSNSRAVCNNRRNLTDEQFTAIKNSGGIVGINFYPKFLCESGKAEIKDIIAHIEHFLSLGGENNICMGADFDGVDILPENINGIWDIGKLFDEMLRLGYSETLIKKLSYTNMEGILKENL